MSGQLYTSSRLRVLRQCLRLHFYRYTLGLDGGQSNDMRFGTVAHSALEAYFRAWQTLAGQLTDDMTLGFRLAAANTVVHDADLAPFDKAKLRVMLTAYDARWGGEPWEVLAVEQEFRYQLGEYTIVGKIDAIVRDTRDGRVYVLEHKTTGADASLGSAYWERLTIDTQVSIYIDGAAILGYEIAGCVYDVLKRPAHEQKLATPIESREYTKGVGCSGCGGSGGGKKGIVQGRGFYGVAFASEVKRVDCGKCAGTGWKLDEKTGKPQAPRLHANQRDVDETVDEFETRLTEAIAEAPDQYLLRGTVVRLEGELEPMRRDLIETIKMERMASLLDVAPRNPDACVKGGRVCSFFEICAGRATTNQFPQIGAHPELAAA